MCAKSITSNFQMRKRMLQERTLCNEKGNVVTNAEPSDKQKSDFETPRRRSMRRRNIPPQPQCSQEVQNEIVWNCNSPGFLENKKPIKRLGKFNRPRNQLIPDSVRQFVQMKLSSENAQAASEKKKPDLLSLWRAPVDCKLKPFDPLESQTHLIMKKTQTSEEASLNLMEQLNQLRRSTVLESINIEKESRYQENAGTVACDIDVNKAEEGTSGDSPTKALMPTNLKFEDDEDSDGLEDAFNDDGFIEVSQRLLDKIEQSQRHANTSNEKRLPDGSKFSSPNMGLPSYAVSQFSNAIISTPELFLTTASDVNGDLNNAIPVPVVKMNSKGGLVDQDSARESRRDGKTSADSVLCEEMWDDDYDSLDEIMGSLTYDRPAKSCGELMNREVVSSSNFPVETLNNATLGRDTIIGGNWKSREPAKFQPEMVNGRNGGTQRRPVENKHNQIQCSQICSTSGTQHKGNWRASQATSLRLSSSVDGERSGPLMGMSSQICSQEDIERKKREAIEKLRRRTRSGSMRLCSPDEIKRKKLEAMEKQRRRKNRLPLIC